MCTQPESQEYILIGVAWLDISVLFVGLPDWYFHTICAVLSRSIQLELRTNCTKCYAMINLEKKAYTSSRGETGGGRTLPRPPITT